MPFRARLKNAFRRSSTTSSSSTNDSKSRKTQNSNERLDPNDPSVYKPHELPRPKYKMPPDRKHTAKLESFNFANSWRRKSYSGSQYSPGGSRVSSARNSVSNDGTISPEMQKSAWKRGKSGVERVEEAPDDKGDVKNVGLASLRHSKELPPIPPEADPKRHEADPDLQGQPPSEQHNHATAHDHRPFTETEIEQALRRSRIQAPLPITA